MKWSLMRNVDSSAFDNQVLVMITIDVGNRNLRSSEDLKDQEMNI